MLVFYDFVKSVLIMSVQFSNYLVICILTSVLDYLRVKVGKTIIEYKARKFRHFPEMLEEKEISGAFCASNTQDNPSMGKLVITLVKG